MHKLWTTTAVLGLALGACRGAPQATVKEAAMTEWKGQFSGALQGAQRVIRSEPEWQAAWAEIGQGAPAAPDFKSSVVVAVFLGQRNTGGYRVEWLESDSSGTATVVRYKEKKPQGIAMRALTQPYAVKVFPRSRSPITVEAENVLPRSTNFLQTTTARSMASGRISSASYSPSPSRTCCFCRERTV